MEIYIYANIVVEAFNVIIPYIYIYVYLCTKGTENIFLQYVYMYEYVNEIISMVHCHSCMDYINAGVHFNIFICITLVT